MHDFVDLLIESYIPVLQPAENEPMHVTRMFFKLDRRWCDLSPTPFETAVVLSQRVEKTNPKL
jgi:hypothetical protein